MPKTLHSPTPSQFIPTKYTTSHSFSYNIHLQYTLMRMSKDWIKLYDNAFFFQYTNNYEIFMGT